MSRLIDADKLYPDRMTNKGTVAISQSQIAKAPTVQAVPIPENATNGDVIKAMFPNIIRTGTILSDKRENIIATNINLNWWDLPYKGSDVE